MYAKFYQNPSRIGFSRAILHFEYEISWFCVGVPMSHAHAWVPGLGAVPGRVLGWWLWHVLCLAVRHAAPAPPLVLCPHLFINNFIILWLAIAQISLSPLLLLPPGMLTACSLVCCSNIPSTPASQATSDDRPAARPKGHQKSASTSHAVRDLGLPHAEPASGAADPLRQT